jgi:hypothetical protein
LPTRALVGEVAGAVTSGRGRSAAVSGPRGWLLAAAGRVVDAAAATGVLAGLATVDIVPGVDVGVGFSADGADAADLPASRGCVRAEVLLAVLLPLADVFLFGVGFFAITGILKHQSVCAGQVLAEAGVRARRFGIARRRQTRRDPDLRVS